MSISLILRRRLRVVLPWLAAGCSGLLFLTMIVSALSIRSAGKAESADKEHQGFVQKTMQSIEQGLVSALSLVPGGKKEIPLIAAIIENHADARPYQQGISEAIVVFEKIVEGDITRFLAIYSRDALPKKKIGSTRSLRPEFLQVAEAWRPLFLHIGGSAAAYEYLYSKPSLKHHDGIRYDGITYERDRSIPAPHNVFMPRENLEKLLEKEGEELLHPVSLPLFPVGGAFPKGTASAPVISVDYRSPNHNVLFAYDAFDQRYERSIFGAPRQASPSNLLFLETDVMGYGTPGAVPWTKTVGKGKLLFAVRGKIMEGTWIREQDGPFHFTDNAGNDLPFSRGQTWIAMLPNLRAVEWE